MQELSISGDIQNGAAAHSTRVEGDRVRAIIETDWLRFERLLRAYLTRWFGTAFWAHDDIIGKTALILLENAEYIETRHQKDGYSLEGQIYGFAKKCVEHEAYGAARRKHRHIRLADTEGDYDPENDCVQPIIRLGAGAPHQTEVVFLKQIIERAGRLDDLELETLHDMVEPRDLWETIVEMQLPVHELIKLSK